MKDLRKTVMFVLDRLPPDATLEDLIYQLYACSRIEKGLADIKAGRVIDDDEMGQRIKNWGAPTI